MNTENINIFIDRLVNEGQFSQKGELPAALLELTSSDGQAQNIDYLVNAYITDDHLIINFDVKAKLQLPCKICNELTTFSLECLKQTHLVPLNEIKKGLFEAADLIRQTVLLNIPPYCECEGNCPERAFVNKFLKKEAAEPETYHPFQGL